MRARKLGATDLPSAHPVSAYLVRFWRDDSADDGAAGGATGDDWEVDDVDVEELIAWARERRAGRQISVWARVEEPADISDAHVLLVDEHRLAS